MSSNPIQRTLLVRLDRIGDLVLTLPVDQGLGPENVQWWIPQGLSFVTQAASPRRAALEIPKKIDLKGFWSLWRKLRREKFSRVVVFHAPWWVSALVWLARIPVRVGVKSQWHSFLFFNRGIRQKRSRADKSELEYNFRLVEEGLWLPEGHLPRMHLKIAAQWTDRLSKFGLKTREYAVVHPGMAGSARNWPVDHYAQFIRRVTASQTVAITGTAADLNYLEPLRELLKDLEGNPHLVWLDQKISGPDLVAVLGNADFVLAPSTGVLHLAASTGRPTIGLYSPVRVQRAVRWGPKGERTETLTPDVKCPGELSCLGEACPVWDCMPEITVASVLAHVAQVTRPLR